MSLTVNSTVQTAVSKVVPLIKGISTKRVQNPEPKKILGNTIDATLEEKDESKNLGNGWYKLSPFLNAWTKVVETGLDVPPSVWILVYVKEPASIYYGIPHKPVPKKSLIYTYILSKDPSKQSAVRRLEEEIVNSFLEAKRFLPIGLITQTGLEIVAGKGFFMSVRGLFGVEVCYKDVDEFLKAIENNDEALIKDYKTFYKAGFVHEIVHQLRKEFEREEDVGQEIATYAVEILSGLGENYIKDEYLNEIIRKMDKIDKVENASYIMDIIAALKLVQHLLSKCSACEHTPKDFTPYELNKAIKSISKDRREKILKKMANKIIEYSPIELLREALDVKMTTLKLKPKNTSKKYKASTDDLI